MRYEMIVKNKNGEWSEEVTGFAKVLEGGRYCFYRRTPYSLTEAKDFAEKTIKCFNKNLLPYEESRTLVNVRLAEDINNFTPIENMFDVKLNDEYEK